MLAPHVGDRGHDLRSNAYAVDGVVPRVLVVRYRQRRHLRAGPAAHASDRVVPERVGDVAPVAFGADRPGRELLSGQVEVDETYIGGEEAGLAGGRAKGKKALVAVAVEVKQPKGFGRCRMRVIPDGSASTLHTFITDNVATGSTVITDGWSGYLGIDKSGYPHDRRSQRAAKALGEDIGKLLPGVHRVASLAKRWLLSTHQGAVDVEHLPGYLEEFCFRFNRRRSRSRGLVFLRVLQLAVGHDPVRYQQLVKRHQPRKAPPRPPGATGHPPNIDRPRATRPRQRYGQHNSG